MVNVTDARYGKMLYLENDVFSGRSYELYGESNFHEVELLQQLVCEGDTVIDVGANIGSITVPLAQKVGPSGKVIAFEPQTFIYNVLCGNIALNNLHNVRAFNSAVGDFNEDFYWIPKLDYQTEMNYGGVSVLTNPDTFDEMNYKGGDILDRWTMVSATPLSHLQDPKPKLIKIDVEGQEREVLDGAKYLILKHKPFLHVEFIGNQEKILEFLKSVNYEWHLHEPPMFNQNNFKGNPRDMFVTPDGANLVSCDLVCWPRGETHTLDSAYFTRLEGSNDPRHQEIRKLFEKYEGD